VCGCEGACEPPLHLKCLLLSLRHAGPEPHLRRYSCCHSLLFMCCGVQEALRLQQLLLHHHIITCATHCSDPCTYLHLPCCLQEALRLQQLRHHHIITFLGVSLAGSRGLVLMELAEGG